jgi:hypothetical protein
MLLVGLFLAAVSLTQATPPFTETFGPDGEVKAISDTFISCQGRTQTQSLNAMQDLMAAGNDAEAKYALRLNKCSFVQTGPVQKISKVVDKRCVQETKTADSHYCKFEYYLFELKGQAGPAYYAIYAPSYD